MGLFARQEHKNTEEKNKKKNNNRPKKTPFCILANSTLFLVIFFSLHSFICAKLCFAEHTIKKCFQQSTAFRYHR